MLVMEATDPLNLTRFRVLTRRECFLHKTRYQRASVFIVSNRSGTTVKHLNNVMTPAGEELGKWTIRFVILREATVNIKHWGKRSKQLVTKYFSYKIGIWTIDVAEKSITSCQTTGFIQFRSSNVNLYSKSNWDFHCFRSEQNSNYLVECAEIWH